MQGMSDELGWSEKINNQPTAVKAEVAFINILKSIGT